MGLANSFGGGIIGKANAAAGTVYYAVIPGQANGYARVASLGYTSGATANSFFGMRPIGRSNITQAQTTSDSTLTLVSDPSAPGNTIAAGDQVVYGPCVDGTFRRAQVNTSGWNGTSKVLTFTAALAANVNTTCKVYNFGINTDTNPTDSLAHPELPVVASSTNVISLPNAGFAGYAKGDPLLIYNPNATAATNLNYGEFCYTVE